MGCTTSTDFDADRPAPTVYTVTGDAVTTDECASSSLARSSTVSSNASTMSSAARKRACKAFAQGLDADPLHAPANWPGTPRHPKNDAAAIGGRTKYSDSIAPTQLDEAYAAADEVRSTGSGGRKAVEPSAAELDARVTQLRSAVFFKGGINADPDQFAADVKRELELRPPEDAALPVTEVRAWIAQVVSPAEAAVQAAEEAAVAASRTTTLNDNDDDPDSLNGTVQLIFTIPAPVITSDGSGQYVYPPVVVSGNGDSRPPTTPSLLMTQTRLNSASSFASTSGCSATPPGVLAGRSPAPHRYLHYSALNTAASPPGFNDGDPLASCPSPLLQSAASTPGQRNIFGKSPNGFGSRSGAATPITPGTAALTAKALARIPSVRAQ